MRPGIAFLLLILTSFSGFPQGTLLYNNYGQLRIDTTYSIEVGLLNRVSSIERNLCYLYDAVEYPDELIYNDIEGIVIAKIHIDNELSSFSCEVVKSTFSYLDKYVLDAINDCKDVFFPNKELYESYEIFLPFMFEADYKEFMDDMKDYRAIRIRKHKLIHQVPL